MMTRAFLSIVAFLANLPVRYVVVGVTVAVVLALTLGVTLGLGAAEHAVPVAGGTAWTNP